MSQRLSMRRALALMAALLTLPLLVLGFTSAPASASNVVNKTIQVPATVAAYSCISPVFSDTVGLSGQIHIVITATANNSGGYQTTNSMNSQFTGASLVTGTKYVNSENQLESWEAQPPFPVIHTHTYDFELVSQSNTPNYVVHMTMHETITANGVPTAVVDNWSMGCKG